MHQSTVQPTEVKITATFQGNIFDYSTGQIFSKVQNISKDLEKNIFYKKCSTENIYIYIFVKVTFSHLPCLYEGIYYKSVGSQTWCDAGEGLCMAHVICCPPIIAYGTHHSPLHGHPHSLSLSFSLRGPDKNLST